MVRGEGRERERGREGIREERRGQWEGRKEREGFARRADERKSKGFIGIIRV